MVMSDWLVALYPVKDVLKCAITMSGVQFVMTLGMILMLKLFVDKQGSQVCPTVALAICDFIATTISYSASECYVCSK